MPTPSKSSARSLSLFDLAALAGKSGGGAMLATLSNDQRAALFDWSSEQASSAANLIDWPGWVAPKQDAPQVVLALAA